jgi:hypothetical protein
VAEGMSRGQTARAVRQLEVKAIDRRKPKAFPPSTIPPAPSTTSLSSRLPSTAQVVLTITGEAIAKEIDALKQALHRLGAKQV